MSAHDVALEAAERAAGLIGTIVREHTAWKHQHPYPAYRYHRSRMESLPDWRRIARAWHYTRMLKFRALWQSSRDVWKCEAAETKMEAD